MGIENYFRPIFARGKDSQISPAQTRSDGDLTINVATLGGQFTVGDHLFMSKSDDTLPQYLGPITLKTFVSPNTTLTFTLPISRGFSSDSTKIWTPTKFWRPEWGTTANAAKGKESGVNTRMSIGGQPNATQVADPSETLTFDFNPSLPPDMANWEVFLFTDMLGGLKSFSVSWYDQMLSRTRLVKVKKRMGDDNWISTLRGIHVGFSATFFIEAEDTYPTPL